MLSVSSDTLSLAYGFYPYKHASHDSIARGHLDICPAEQHEFEVSRLMLWGTLCLDEWNLNCRFGASTSRCLVILVSPLHFRGNES